MYFKEKLLIWCTSLSFLKLLGIISNICCYKLYCYVHRGIYIFVCIPDGFLGEIRDPYISIFKMFYKHWILLSEKVIAISILTRMPIFVTPNQQSLS